MKPNADALPVLVVYGSVAWMLVWVLGTLAWVLWLRRRRARRLAPSAAPGSAMTPTRMLVTALVAGALLFGGLCGLGQVALSASRGDQFANEGEPLNLSNFNLVALAAALPLSREEALRRLEWALKRHNFRDERAVERRVAVAEMRDGCAGVARVLTEESRLEYALARQQACGLRQEAFKTLALLGRHDEATAMLDEGLVAEATWQEGRIDITAGRWDLAANAAERWSQYWADSDLLDLAIRQPQVQWYHCLSEYFRGLAGDSVARERLSAMAAAPEYRACGVMVALGLPTAERRAALTEIAHDPTIREDHFALAALAANLAWADGVPNPELSSYWAISGVVGVNRADALWLAPWALKSLHAEGTTGAPAAFALSAEASNRALAGEFDAAREMARDAEGSGARDMDVLRAAIEMRAHSGPPTGPSLARDRVAPLYEPLSMRLGNPTAREGAAIYAPECQEVDFISALASAQQGDGAALAAMMQGCNIYQSEITRIFAVAPLAVRHREALAEAVRWLTFDESSNYPFSWVLYAALRRDLLRQMGLVEEAAGWQSIVAALVEALSHRDRSVSLLLWGTVVPM